LLSSKLWLLFLACSGCLAGSQLQILVRRI
jgi:hypothetical protein